MKLRNAKSALCMTAVVLVTLPTLPLQAAIKQNVSSTQETVNVDNHQLLALSWGDIWDKLRRKKGKRGSRSDDDKDFFCMISPGKLTDPNGGKQTLVVWGTRPVFLWREDEKTIKGIKVYHTRSNELMWSQSLDSKTRSIIYQGKPLQPGEDYFWREDLPLEKLPSRVSFRIMKAEERQTISAELKELETKLKAKGASADKIVLARVEYFAEKELWSDMLREIYSVKNPSPELKQKIKQIESHDFCPPEKGEQKLGLVSGK